MTKRVIIQNADCAYEYEPFRAPFGFKGKTLSGVWQTAACLSCDTEIGVGLGIQSVLWSDGGIFAEYGEERGNELMFAVTEHAAALLRGKALASASEAISLVFDECHSYAEKICGMRVSKTFVLNALVPIDFATHQLFARMRGDKNFDLIFKGNGRQNLLVSIPLITYATPASEVAEMARQGVPLFKIKFGFDPLGDGDRARMLEWDKARALEIHEVLKEIKTPYTDCGGILYYFDANGRYDTKERLCQLVDFLTQNGIAERTVLFEEPFEESNKIFIGDLPLTFAADESAHSVADVRERIALGYRAITLKPIAKTASITAEMAKVAESLGAECFCADLTVNPTMVEWNKQFAARLLPLKGMKIGVFESNGAQNYVHWEKMKSYLPQPAGPEAPILSLSDAFFEGGGIFDVPAHYLNLIRQRKNRR